MLSQTLIKHYDDATRSDANIQSRKGRLMAFLA